MQLKRKQAAANHLQRLQQVTTQSPVIGRQGRITQPPPMVVGKVTKKALAQAQQQGRLLKKRKTHGYALFSSDLRKKLASQVSSIFLEIISLQFSDGHSNCLSLNFHTVFNITFLYISFQGMTILDQTRRVAEEWRNIDPAKKAMYDKKAAAINFEAEKEYNQQRQVQRQQLQYQQQQQLQQRLQQRPALSNLPASTSLRISSVSSMASPEVIQRPQKAVNLPSSISISRVEPEISILVEQPPPVSPRIPQLPPSTQLSVQRHQPAVPASPIPQRTRGRGRRVVQMPSLTRGGVRGGGMGQRGMVRPTLVGPGGVRGGVRGGMVGQRGMPRASMMGMNGQAGYLMQQPRMMTYPSPRGAVGQMISPGLKRPRGAMVGQRPPMLTKRPRMAVSVLPEVTGIGNPVPMSQIGHSDRMCRLCGCSISQSGSMFRISDSDDLKEKIDLVLAIKIDTEAEREGGYPDVACRKCCQYVLAFSTFKKTVDEGMVKLSQIIASRKKAEEEAKLRAAQFQAAKEASEQEKQQLQAEPFIGEPEEDESSSFSILPDLDMGDVDTEDVPIGNGSSAPDDIEEEGVDPLTASENNSGTCDFIATAEDETESPFVQLAIGGATSLANMADIAETTEEELSKANEDEGSVEPSIESGDAEMAENGEDQQLAKEDDSTERREGKEAAEEDSSEPANENDSELTGEKEDGVTHSKGSTSPQSADKGVEEEEAEAFEDTMSQSDKDAIASALEESSRPDGNDDDTPGAEEEKNDVKDNGHENPGVGEGDLAGSQNEDSQNGMMDFTEDSGGDFGGEDPSTFGAEDSSNFETEDPMSFEGDEDAIHFETEDDPANFEAEDSTNFEAEDSTNFEAEDSTNFETESSTAFQSGEDSNAADPDFVTDALEGQSDNAFAGEDNFGLNAAADQEEGDNAGEAADSHENEENTQNDGEEKEEVAPDEVESGLNKDLSEPMEVDDDQNAEIEGELNEKEDGANVPADNEEEEESKTEENPTALQEELVENDPAESVGDIPNDYETETPTNNDDGDRIADEDETSNSPEADQDQMPHLEEGSEPEGHHGEEASESASGDYEEASELCTKEISSQDDQTAIISHKV